METIEQTAERYVSAVMGNSASATVYRERMVELAQNLIREGVNRTTRAQRAAMYDRFMYDRFAEDGL